MGLLNRLHIANALDSLELRTGLGASSSFTCSESQHARSDLARPRGKGGNQPVGALKRLPR